MVYRENVFDKYGDSHENLLEILAVVVILSPISSICVVRCISLIIPYLFLWIFQILLLNKTPPSLFKVSVVRQDTQCPGENDSKLKKKMIQPELYFKNSVKYRTHGNYDRVGSIFVSRFRP